jgi:hypothetical protein
MPNVEAHRSGVGHASGITVDPGIVSMSSDEGEAMKARDLVNAGEKTVAIFTHGTWFEHSPDGTGSTGKWVIDPNHPLDRAIIYHRDDKAQTNTVYTADIVGVVSADAEKRYTIQLAHICHCGETPLNWPEFAEGGQNPIRYL